MCRCGVCGGEESAAHQQVEAFEVLRCREVLDVRVGEQGRALIMRAADLRVALLVHFGVYVASRA